MRYKWNRIDLIDLDETFAKALPRDFFTIDCKGLIFQLLGFCKGFDKCWYIECGSIEFRRIVICVFNNQEAGCSYLFLPLVECLSQISYLNK
ncbi:hypothetical protein SAMN05216419_10552 [Nitrosomonas cryotolerans]|uniref:Uncharacterized protein n=1 Tax=Nitrosomonas cryotolerans ATCC 49181 TaxID=1131553 RepID=A0A1N6H2D6_9PROT|nr:hypothetical protein SAMN05216419_10552 [Nitrosomonas cryotolerans]SIO13950.1 hypothetical protein SAMN02743940_0985 [Nitrosomonas cryotolerans ATCC 49181]